MYLTSIYTKIDRTKDNKGLLNYKSRSTVNIFADTTPNIQIRIPDTINSTKYNNQSTKNSHRLLASTSYHTSTSSLGSSSNNNNNNGPVGTNKPITISASKLLHQNLSTSPASKTYTHHMSKFILTSNNTDVTTYSTKKQDDESIANADQHGNGNQLGGCTLPTEPSISSNNDKQIPQRVLKKINLKCKKLKCKTSFDNLDINNNNNNMANADTQSLSIVQKELDANANEILILPELNIKNPLNTLYETTISTVITPTKRKSTIDNIILPGTTSMGVTKYIIDTHNTNTNLMATSGYLENNPMRSSNINKKSFYNKLQSQEAYDTVNTNYSPKETIADYLMYLNARESENEQAFKTKLELFSINGAMPKYKYNQLNKDNRLIEGRKSGNIQNPETKKPKSEIYSTKTGNKSQKFEIHDLNDVKISDSIIIQSNSPKKVNSPEKIDTKSKLNTSNSLDKINTPVHASYLKSYVRTSKRNLKKKQDAKILAEVEMLLENYRLFYDNIAKYKCSEENFRKIMGESQIIIDLFQSKSIKGKFREPPTAQKLLNTIRGVTVPPKKSGVTSNSLRRVSLYTTKPISTTIDPNIVKALRSFNERIEEMNLEYLLAGIKNLQTGLFKLQDENIEKEKTILPKIYKANLERFINTKELCELQHNEITPNPNYNLSTRLNVLESKDGELGLVSMRNKRINKEYDNLYENLYLNCWKIAQDKNILAKVA